MKFCLKTIILALFAFLAFEQLVTQESASRKPYRIIISSDFPPLDVSPEKLAMVLQKSAVTRMIYNQWFRSVATRQFPEFVRNRFSEDLRRDDGTGATSVSMWLADIQKDFATRADWMWSE